jgi:response regulator RpfG family c-di-GMP phosphodiesterase
VSIPGVDRIEKSREAHVVAIVLSFGPRIDERLATQVDLIVTALLLAGALDSYALIDRLHHNRHTRKIPTIVLTVCAWTSSKNAR